MSLSPRKRFEVLKRDGFTCHYCGRKPPKVVLHVDHIHPRSLGGEDDLENYLTACADCNLGKSDIPLSAVGECHFCEEEPGVYVFEVTGGDVWVCPDCLRTAVFEFHWVTRPESLICAGCGKKTNNSEGLVFPPWLVSHGRAAWVCSECSP